MRLILIDGHNLFIRNFVKNPTLDSNGSSIGGIVGFLKSLKSFISDANPDRVIVAWDGEGGSVRRRKIYSDYKSGRKIRLNRGLDLESQDESFQNLHEQMQVLRNALDLMGITQVSDSGCEADDVISFLCKHVFSDEEKVVYTSDKDMLQLIDQKTLVYSPTKKTYFTIKKMVEEHGVRPENFAFVKAMMGDGSDNIKGIGGIGEKTALKLFPFLAERTSSVSEIKKFVEEHSGESNKYQKLLDNWSKFMENMKLMDLSSPLFSGFSAEKIISQSKRIPKFSFTELKLFLIQNDIQIDQDLWVTLNRFKMKAEKQ